MANDYRENRLKGEVIAEYQLNTLRELPIREFINSNIIQRIRARIPGICFTLDINYRGKPTYLGVRLNGISSINKRRKSNIVKTIDLVIIPIYSCIC